MSEGKKKFMASYGHDPASYMKPDDEHPYSVVLRAINNPTVTKDDLLNSMKMYTSYENRSSFIVKKILEAAHDRGWRHGEDGLEEHLRKFHPEMYKQV